jgi:hypothetical protein
VALSTEQIVVAEDAEDRSGSLEIGECIFAALPNGMVEIVAPKERQVWLVSRGSRERPRGGPVIIARPMDMKVGKEGDTQPFEVGWEIGNGYGIAPGTYGTRFDEDAVGEGHEPGKQPPGERAENRAGATWHGAYPSTLAW